MSEQEEGLGGIFPGKINLQMISELLLTMEMDFAATQLEFFRQHLAEMVHCLLVMAGRFDFDKTAQDLQ